MSEFTMQFLISDLFEILGSKKPPVKAVEILQKYNDKRAHSVPSSSRSDSRKIVHKIAKQVENSREFYKMLEDLEQKNVECLPQFLRLLLLISLNVKLKTFLSDVAKREVYASFGLAFTKADLPEVRSRLKKAITKPKIIDDLPPMSLVTIKDSSARSRCENKSNISWDFPHFDWGPHKSTIPGVSVENLLIDELLNVLIGLPGLYIEPENYIGEFSQRTFKISDVVPTYMKELVKQILQLACYHSIIQRFIEEKIRIEFGRVNNALAEQMMEIIKEYRFFIVQLETESRQKILDLQRLWFFVQRNMQTIGVAANIASIISKSNAKGGRVLSLLHDQIVTSISDDKIQNMSVKLMEGTCVPYMKMLSMWIYSGIIDDPKNEFLIEDNEVVQKEDMPLDYSSDYWARKYSIRRERIPTFLQPLADKILKTGKYLNVIRQCGKPNEMTLQKIEYKTQGRNYVDSIETAYCIASQTLLDLVMIEEDLMGRLKSVKNYFLLEKGDFILLFMSLTQKEMNRHMGDVIYGRLEALLDLSLRLSSANTDPYKDELCTELLPYGLQFQMLKILSIQTSAEDDYRVARAKLGSQKNLKIVESFAFSYKVHWPLSLIFNRKSLTCYQMIFRHLFYCKHVDLTLCQVWRSNKVAKKFAFENAQQYRAAFALRQKMLNCVQNLEYHMTIEVIEPHWNTFLERIAKASNVDDVLWCHSEFLDNCLKDCMLTIPHILATLTKILGICIEFCQFLQRTQRYFVEAELGCLPNSMYESFHAQVEVVSNQINGDHAPSFKEKISEFNKNFTSTLLTLLEQINELNQDTREHDRILNLLYRLDFNSFYSKRKSDLESSEVAEASG